MKFRAITLLLLIISTITIQGVTSGPLLYASCQAGCAGVAVACWSAAGAIFGLTPLAIIAASPALTLCNTKYGACYSACSASLWAPTP